MDIFAQEWVWWAVALAVGVPVLLVVLTEVLGALQRRGSRAAGPVRMLRNWVVPAGAVLVLFIFADHTPVEHTWARVAATVFGALVILLVLSAFNAMLRSKAKPGSWRERIPSIFVEIARLLLVVVGLGLLFRYVWGADVGGLIAALGVTGLVIGLALQHTVGSIVSGLLLLFEQPFKLGDWLEVGGVTGRVVEVNWRSAHLDTGTGIEIIPNGSLADDSFKNLSRPGNGFNAATTVKFSTDDPPFEVQNLLISVADDLPQLATGEEASVTYAGNATYNVEIPVTSPGLADAAISQYLIWLWYAARRAGFALDGDSTDPIAEPEHLDSALQFLVPHLHMGADTTDELKGSVRLLRYAAGETVVRQGVVPQDVYFIISGKCALSVALPNGGELALGEANHGEIIAGGALMRQKTDGRAVALDEVTVLAVPLATLDSVVRAHPRLAVEIGDSIELRRRAAREALAPKVVEQVVADAAASALDAAD